ncbi:response regulator [Roseovarius salinarum]|uniref:response regulator n=1 Tax=Roseovarius salinarum TaxID=1981892 RepID=UPI000C346509|nr:response regulator [Roseovarius salinarum]
MDDLDRPDQCPSPTATRPLLGLTVLVVEDSRFACDAMRLLCLRSGARIRRADCILSARRHLQVYRPSAVVVDIGLPDGSGLDLISELARAHPRVGALLGTSGDDGLRERALAAGADGFLAKPVTQLAVFQQTLLDHMPADRQPPGPRKLTESTVTPDIVAFRDDMAHAATLLDDCDRDRTLDYALQFIGGVAKAANDGPLRRAITETARARRQGETHLDKLARLSAMVQERVNREVAI